MCRPGVAPAAVPLVPSKAPGPSRAGSRPVTVFQPTATAASAAASTTAQGSSSGANDAADATPPLPIGSLDVQAVPSARPITGNQLGTSVISKAANPYAEVPGRRGRGISIVQGVAMGNSLPSATHQQQQQQQQQQRLPYLSSTEAASGLQNASQQSGDAVNQLPSSQSGADGAEELVTTYSSFSHDPVSPYTAFGPSPTIAYTESGNLIDAFDVRAATNAAHDLDSGTLVPTNFDDMTELQL